VADASGNRVVAFDSSGTPLRSWGTSGTAPGQFLGPVDVAAGPGGQLLVAEPLRGTGEIVPLYAARTPFSYHARIAYRSLWSSGGGVLGTRLFSPTAVAFAPDGSVWVADRNNKLLRHLSGDGHLLGAVGAPAGAGPASLTEPRGLDVDSAGAVIVADTGANRVDKLAPDGRTLGAWSAPGAGGGNSAAGAAQGAQSFRRPLAVAAGANDTIYVADTGNARVVALDAGGRLIASWGGRGRAPGRFGAPGGIAVDSAGHVFVSDGVLDRIQEFTPGGKLLALWGVGGSSLGELSEPAGMAVDCHGDLLVADTGNNRVQVFTGVAAPAPCKA
jgi:DNA-binding beta-propeller fold protein YncE